MDQAAYLRRIGLDDAPPVDRDGLEMLQRAHLTAVPFENLDVYRRSGVQTGLGWSIPKIVTRGRGGWCFELNGAFSSLLSELGFPTRRLAATVLGGDTVSTMPNHLTIRVDLERPYLADVGFGDSFIVPLPLDTTEPIDGGTGTYRLRSGRGTKTLEHRDDEGRWVPDFSFGESDVPLASFDASSELLLRQPGLLWSELPFATRLIDGGPDRVTLLADRIKFRRNEIVTETPVPPEAWDGLLEQWFGLPPEQAAGFFAPGGRFLLR